ncbi:hypothetical protein D3C84_1027590 [compost metagenome]
MIFLENACATVARLEDAKCRPCQFMSALAPGLDMLVRSRHVFTVEGLFDVML